MKSACLTISILLGSSVLGQDLSLTLASDVWPPFTNTEGERSVSINIVREALRRMDVHTEFIITDFDTVVAGLNKGTFEGSAALWRSGKREETMIFSNAYLENQLILVGRKGSDPNVDTIADLYGKRIGLVGGYAYDDTFMTDDRIQKVFGESDQENLEHLLSGEIDLMLVDELLIRYLLEYEMNDVTSLLEFSAVPMLHKPLYFALNKNVLEAERTMVRFNSTINQMIADGTYNRLLELSWIRADVDGDGVQELIFTGNEAGITPPTDVYDVVHTDGYDSPHGYYVNGNMYASWDEIPADTRVAPRTMEIPPVVVPNDGLIRF